MNPEILNTAVQAYINQNLNSNVAELILKGKTFNGASTLELAQQIESKQKCKSKLPTWFFTENIYYPQKVHIEQTSSEETARYKAEVLSGNTIIDLTGGFGVDCLYFSKNFKDVDHCEINIELSKIATHNFRQLNVKNIKTILGNGIAYLKTKNQNYDWIYIDPSRRHDSKGKVFFLRDCKPNLPQNLNAIFDHTTNVAIKTSPLLDLTAGISELKFVRQIHIIALNNEVKELFWILSKNYNEGIDIITSNITNQTTESFNFNLYEEQNLDICYAEPKNFLYEPNSAILKAGAFKVVAERLRIDKLHQHSHLYTADHLINFPGRRFKIETVLNYNKKAFKKLKLKKANVTVRNFPNSVRRIRETFKIAEGGTVYLFFTTDLNNNKIIIKCSRIT